MERLLLQRFHGAQEGTNFGGHLPHRIIFPDRDRLRDELQSWRGCRQACRQAVCVIAAVLVVLLTACGGERVSGENAAPAPPNVSATSSESANVDYFDVTSDQYTLLKPDFYYSTNNASFWSIEAATAKDVWDVDWRTIARIDIPKTDGQAFPQLNTSYSIEANGPYPVFPGDFLVLNGAQSTYKKVEQGIIVFSPDSDAAAEVQGTFDVVLVDYDSAIVPAPQYRITGAFHFLIGTYGPEFR